VNKDVMGGKGNADLKRGFGGDKYEGRKVLIDD
jgi:hypothetical protein